MHATEMYKGTQYRVCWSHDEKVALERNGWSAIADEGVSYTPISAGVDAEAKPAEAKKGPGRPKKSDSGELES